MAKDYTIESCSRALNGYPGINISGNTIKVLKDAPIGIKTWAKIGFLQKNGYILEKVDKLQNEKIYQSREEYTEVKRRKKNNIEIDVISGVTSMSKLANFKIKK